MSCPFCGRPGHAMAFWVGPGPLCEDFGNEAHSFKIRRRASPTTEEEREWLSR